MTNALETLLGVNCKENRDGYARDIHNNGGKVIGYLCAYVPEELIYAAGMFPYRVMGSWWETPPVSGGYLSANSCPFCRTVLEDVLERRHPFIDGVITTTSCRIMSRLFDHWESYGTPQLSFILDLPHKVNSDSIDAYKIHMLELKKKLEDYTGVEITAQSLGEAIDIYNSTRRLLLSMYELRKEKSPLISGAESMAIVLASMVMPKTEYNGMLEEALSQIKERGKRHDGDARIMVSGSILSNHDEIKVIEDQGGLVVADDLCTGSHYFWNQVRAGADLQEQMDNLADRYLSRIPCARMFDNEPRYDFMKQMIEEYDVHGVIYTTLKYCDPWIYNYPLTASRMEEIDIPVLRLEREYSLMAAGQTSTRVGAFLEMLV